MRKKLVCLLLVTLLVLSSTGIAAYAGQPDRTYTYEDSEAVPSTNIYQVKKIVDASIMGTTRMANPSDIFVDNSDRVFILDRGNCRVLILDKDYKLIKELKDFTYEGKTVNLGLNGEYGAEGLFFRESNKSLYIADTVNNRIIVSDLEGNISKIYNKPEDELLVSDDPDAPVKAYKPQKIIVDNMGIMYVDSADYNTGAMMVDSANNFLGFYGTNKLKMTAAMQLEYFWRSILTEAQNAQSDQSFQTVEFQNVFWSEDRFVYAVSPIVENLAATVVKLNALGRNVFTQNIDFNTIETNSGIDNMNLVDITVDNEGVFTVVDSETGRLFQYDENCNLLGVFGGIGYQKGLFISGAITAIESDSENNLLVLDSNKGTITVMEQTYYGKMIRSANNLYNEGRYLESIEPWMDVLRMNANYTRAYVGLGKAYIGMGEYEKAMDFFIVGGDKDGYAEAKAALRDETVREYFGLVAAVVIVAMIGILGSDQIKEIFNKIAWKLATRKKGE